MTNADKYLRDGADVRKFREKLAQFIFSELGFYDLGFYDGTEEAIDTVIGDFLDMIEKPQLTEDERVILRNLNKEIYTTIGLDTYGLYLHNDNVACCREYAFYDMFGDLFQFIKEGEEYEIAELLGGE